MQATLSLTPSGHLQIIEQGQLGVFATGIGPAQESVEDPIVAAFAKSQAAGLLALAGAKIDAGWPPVLTYWREFAALQLSELCHGQPEEVEVVPVPPPEEEVLAKLALAVPPMAGGEYCTPAVLASIWTDLAQWCVRAMAEESDGLAGFLHHYAPLWRQVGRVCFHLAENKNDPEFPFAFIATYVAKVGNNARLQHQPLSRALNEYAGARNKTALLRLLEPVQEASTKCAWVRDLVESGDIYHPLARSPQEAYEFLRSVPELEASGLVVRLPDWWKKRPRPRVQVSIGNNRVSGLGAAALLDFRVDVTLEEEPLSAEELATLSQAAAGLVLLRGQWVEVDGEKLRQALQHWQQLEKDADGLSFSEGMRLLAGIRRDLSAEEDLDRETSWAFVEPGPWLREILAGLRSPAFLAATDPGPHFKATLRPYQREGLGWLRFVTGLGLGACLADDMGLGKTIQVIALLLSRKHDRQTAKPSLLVLPASLLANWKSEIGRFAPSLKVICLHPAETPKNEMKILTAAFVANPANVDAVLTSYAMLPRQPELLEREWDLVILDEAQAIKNPGSRQTKMVKQLHGRARLALTGTPVENRLGDLWSLFDFLNPGLLGTANRFKAFQKKLEKRTTASYAPLRSLVQPYILRRLKTDRRIIADLPDKTELTAFCGLSKSQTALYAQAVAGLTEALEGEGGIKRRGLILAALMRFKQICNHPDQVLGQGDYPEEKSGKFLRLRELAEEIASRQEKLLLFTQFREMTAPLATFLASIFGRAGLVLHGSTPVRERKQRVDLFQREDGPPFFVLSLKAGGTGLNLTAASHVIHFDRWWNPAVENQATDRAFRIGQTRNVLVHKFVCRGTVEEKIDKLIREKSRLADDILADGAETLLTEMADEALLELISLDLEKASI